MICAAIYTITLKKLCDTYSPWFLTAVQCFIGTVFFLPLLFLPSTELPVTFPAGPVWAVIYLGSCVGVAAYGLSNFGISRLPAWQASAFTNLIPVFSIFMGWLWLDERFSFLQMLGVGVVFGGVLLSQEWPGRSPHQEWKNTSSVSVGGGEMAVSAVRVEKK
jgi:drug/metabolite transporter (DMT)-like permease